MKKIIQVFLSFIIVILMLFLTISSTLNQVIIDGVIKEVIILKTSKKTVNSPNEIINELPIPEDIKNSEEFTKLLESKEVQDLMDKYLNIALENMTEEELQEIDIESDIINYVTENKELIKEITGVEVTDKMIDETKRIMDEHNLNETLEETLKETKKSIPQEAKVVLKGYKEIISTKTKVITISLIILCLLLIALLQKSLYKWIKTAGVCSTITGICVLLMALIIEGLITSMLSISSFNITVLYKAGIIELVIGLIITMSFNITTKLLKKGE